MEVDTPETDEYNINELEGANIIYITETINTDQALSTVGIQEYIFVPNAEHKSVNLSNFKESDLSHNAEKENNYNEDQQMAEDEQVVHTTNSLTEVISGNSDLSERPEFETSEPGPSTAKDFESNAILLWTQEEKFQLLQALQQHGSHDIGIFAHLIATKTSEEIQDAVNYYKQRASVHVNNKKPKRDTQNNKMHCKPLASWANFLTDKFSHDELQTDTVSALRLIADFEDIPPPSLTNQIDFREIYHTLADAMEGKQLSQNQMVKSILEKCITDTALSSKVFIRAQVYNNLIRNLNFSKSEKYEFPKVPINCEWEAIYNLASITNYNPLNIPVTFLKPSIQKSDNEDDSD